MFAKRLAAIVAALIISLFGMLSNATSSTFVQSVNAAPAADYIWGPAGPAPSKDQAAQVLGVNPLLVTVLFGNPGDPTPIGYAVGTDGSEATHVQIAPHFPAGVCIDWDPGATLINAQKAWEVEFTAQWHRAMIESAGNATGLKVSIYWTQCDRSENGVQGKEVPLGGVTTSQPAATSTPAPTQVVTHHIATATPAPAKVASLCGGNPNCKVQVYQNGCCWIVKVTLIGGKNVWLKFGQQPVVQSYRQDGHFVLKASEPGSQICWFVVDNRDVAQGKTSQRLPAPAVKKTPAHTPPATSTTPDYTKPANYTAAFNLPQGVVLTITKLLPPNGAVVELNQAETITVPQGMVLNDGSEHDAGSQLSVASGQVFSAYFVQS